MGHQMDPLKISKNTAISGCKNNNLMIASGDFDAGDDSPGESDDKEPGEYDV